jgi:hypothetical protein
MAGINPASIFGKGATQIDRGILRNALVRARQSGQPGMSLGVKTSVRNMLTDTRPAPGQHSSYVNPTVGDINFGLDQFAKFGNVVPRRGALGPSPSKAGSEMIEGIREHAADFKWGDGDAFLPDRVPKGTVSRSAPANRSMTAAQKKAMIARKRKASGSKGGSR